MATLNNRVTTLGQDEFFKHLSKHQAPPDTITQSANSNSSDSIASTPSTSMKPSSQHAKEKSVPIRLPEIKNTNEDGSEANNQSEIVDNV